MRFKPGLKQDVVIIGTECHRYRIVWAHHASNAPIPAASFERNPPWEGKIGGGAEEGTDWPSLSFFRLETSPMNPSCRAESQNRAGIDRSVRLGGESSTQHRRRFAQELLTLIEGTCH